MIEVEIRSFLTEEQYVQLLAFFNEHGQLVSHDEQETHYFDAPVDVRIQKNSTHSKIWMKQGNMHDDAREELELPFPKEDFGKLQRLFAQLGFQVSIKWFRTRKKYIWDSITVCLDHTKGYGYMLELEQLCNPDEVESVRALLNDKIAMLEVGVTDKKVFAERFDHYKKNWKELTQDF